jgi:Fe-S cluster assembly protein SufD
MTHTFFPNHERAAALQHCMEYGPSSRLKQMRIEALDAFWMHKATLQLPATLSSYDIEWDAITLHDFYVEKTERADGVICADMRDFIREYPQQSASLCVDATMSSTFSALQSFINACYNRGAVIYIPDGVHVKEPINIQQMLGGYRQQLLLERITIIVGTRASATFHDQLIDVHSNVQTIMRSLTYHIGEHAVVSVQADQHMAVSMHEVSTITLHCQAHSVVDYHGSITGFGTTTQWLTVRMEGAQSSARVRGIYALSSTQQAYIATRQEHCAINTVTDLIFKGCIAQHARATYTGVIAVDASASGTQASQDNKNIMLSPQARVISKPSLEVLNHDVQCAHGSAMGQLDVEQVLYMQARGIAKERAHQLLLQAFCADVVSDTQVLACILNKMEQI